MWRQGNPHIPLMGNVSWYSHFGEEDGGSLRMLKTDLSYDPTIPLLGIFTEKTIFQKDTCTPMFTAALFPTAKIWKQPKCPLTGMDKDVIHIYNEMLLSHKG